jgi:hypothetical protein
MEYLEVPDVDWVEGLTHAGRELGEWRARTWERVLAFIRREHKRQPVDLFLGYLYPKHVDIAAIDDIQRLGIPCVNFFCDNVREFAEVPREYRPFALHWVPEYEALPMYRRAGLAHLHAPMPCWVAPGLRTVPAAETEPPCFIGSADLLRRDLLGRALREGADFVVRGPGWSENVPRTENAGPSSGSIGRRWANQWAFVRDKGVSVLAIKLTNRWWPVTPPDIAQGHVRPPVSGEDYLRITREALVAIGVNRVPTARTWDRKPITYSRLRDLEAPMVGACYLTEWTAGLSELYELGTEVEAYRTSEELVAKVDALKADKGRRQGLRARGQQRALAHHSVARSLGRIVERVTGRRAS